MGNFMDANNLQRVTEIAEGLLASLQFELVEVEARHEGRRLVLCLYVDKPGGITLDDCADVSRELSSLLDVEDIVPERYTLEVSSPGLNRPLKRLADFERSIGKLVRVKTNALWQDEAGNKRKTFLGRLNAVRNDSLIIDLNEGQQAVVPINIVSKAHLEFEF